MGDDEIEIKMGWVYQLLGFRIFDRISASQTLPSYRRFHGGYRWICVRFNSFDSTSILMLNDLYITSDNSVTLLKTEPFGTLPSDRSQRANVQSKTMMIKYHISKSTTACQI